MVTVFRFAFAKSVKLDESSTLVLTKYSAVRKSCRDLVIASHTGPLSRLHGGKSSVLELKTLINMRDDWDDNKFVSPAPALTAVAAPIITFDSRISELMQDTGMYSSLIVFNNELNELPDSAGDCEVNELPYSLHTVKFLPIYNRIQQQVITKLGSPSLSSTSKQQHQKWVGFRRRSLDVLPRSGGVSIRY